MQFSLELHSVNMPSKTLDGRFVLKIFRPLGNLHYLRVWHDNSGKGQAASWYLKYIVIHDVQTSKKYYFLCNRWLAVEYGDGMVCQNGLELNNKGMVLKIRMLTTSKTLVYAQCRIERLIKE